MNVIEAIKARYSVRSYKSTPIEEDKLCAVLEAARMAPSASNRQEWRFIVVKDKTTREKLMEAAKGQRFVAQAPIVIACCAVTNNHVMSCGQLCYPIDIAIAIDHMTLKAVEEGLGTCWIGAFFEDKVKKILCIPETPDVRVVELLTLGYPDDTPKKKNRLSIDEVVMHERWHPRFKKS